MMDKQKVNGTSPKENGGLRSPPPYSVETPYGFHLDLDFLKYVDDIEKGNTIRRVPMHRRHREPNSSFLSRNLSLPGHGCRPNQWSSISTLWPKSRLPDSQQLYEFRACDGGPGGCPRLPEAAYKSFTAAEMEASIRAFDEQPLGPHVRPNLLRASSLPMTVLLRKHSESTEDPTGPRSSRDCLAQQNGSSEDIFHSPDRTTSGVNGTLQRLTAALERVGELEEEIRVIPELKAQICILQEERERHLMTLYSQPAAIGSSDSSAGAKGQSSQVDIWNTSEQDSKTMEKQDKTDDDWMCREYDRLERKVKASSVEVEAVVIPSCKRPEPSGTMDLGGSLQEADLDLQDRDPPNPGERAESLSVALQRKLVILEQKLHELEQELDRARALLREQLEESRQKDERIEQMNRNPEVWVRAERASVHQDAARDTSDIEPSPEHALPGMQLPSLSVQGHSTEALMKEARKSDHEVPAEAGANLHEVSGLAVEHADMVHHVMRVCDLLQEQWECLCRGESAEGVSSLEHLPPRVGSIQEQLMSLVNTLQLYVPLAQRGEDIQPSVQSSKMEENSDGRDQTTMENLSSYTRSSRETSWDEGEREGGAHPEEHTQEGADPEEQTQGGANLQEQTDPQHPEEQTSEEADHQEQTQRGANPRENAQREADPQGHIGPAHLDETREEAGLQEQIRGADPDGRAQRGAEEQIQRVAGGETIDQDFMAACVFLKDHMDEMADPNNDMRQALTVVFQEWFHVSAEEDACADTLALYVKEVTAVTPTLLPFLVNMVDDNGNTALHYSVSHSNFSVVRTLLETALCEVDLRNKAGYTAIMLASLTATDSPEEMRVVQQLMELGNINARAGQGGQTALHLAVRHGRGSMVRLLLALGADPNAQDGAGTSPLMSACERGHTDIAKLLLERTDCDITLTDKGGRRAQSLAMQASHTDIAELLKARTDSRSSDRCKLN